jgi:hypothetical protein
MKRLFLLIAATAVLGVVLAAAPLGATGHGQRFVRGGQGFVIGEQLHFTGPNSAAGTFSIAGAFSDWGTVASTFTVHPHPKVVIITGTETFTGALGAITDTFTAISFPVGKPTAIAKGRAVIVSATGPYAAVVGTRLRDLAVFNFATNMHTQTLASRGGD